MCKSCSFTIFTIFNVIFGLSGLGIIALTVLSIISRDCNGLSIISLSLGLAIFFLCVFGLCSKNDKCSLCIYLTLVMIIFLFYGFLAYMVHFYPKELFNFLKNNLEAQVNEIKNENNIQVLYGLCIGSSCCLLAFIFGFCHCCCCSNKKDDDSNYKKVEDEVNKGDIGQIDDDNQEEN